MNGTSMINTFKIILISLVLSTGHASAALMEADFLSDGDGLVTRDTETGLEWLDVTNTLNISISEIMAGYDDLLTTHRFRYASGTEIHTLFEHAGIPIITGTWKYENGSPVHALQGLVGKTDFMHTAGLIHQTKGITGDTAGDETYSGAILEYWVSAGSGQAASSWSSFSTDYKNETIGSFLVRDIDIQSDDFTYHVVPIDSGVTNNILSVIYANGQYIATGSQGTIIISSDGVFWTRRVSNTSERLTAVAYGDGVWVAGGSWYPSPNVILASMDSGATWSSESLYTGHYATTDIIYQDGAFIATTFQGYILRSYDGISWTDLGNATGATLHKIIYGDNLYVVAGYLGRIGSAPSPSGPWSTVRPTSESFYDVAYGNGMYVLVGYGGQIVTSTTGTGGWTLRSSGTDESLQSVTYGDKMFVAVGNAGTVLFSSDGIDWTSIDTGLTERLIAIRYDGSKFLITGNNGLIVHLVQSIDSDYDGLSDEDETGIYWTDPFDPDSDDDGLWDGEEVNIYGSNPLEADSDDDGYNDGFEVSTGFDPTSSASTPDLFSEVVTAIEFKFNGANDVSYRIEATDSLTNTWEIIETDIMGEGDTVKRLYSVERQPNRFFRARRN